MRMLTLVLIVLALSAFIGCQSKPMDGSDGQSAGEGIKVRGDWVIEVRNSDGDLETRREFSNDWVGHMPLAAWLSEDVKVDDRYLVFMLFHPYAKPITESDTPGCEVEQSRPSNGAPYLLFVEASVILMGEKKNNTGAMTKSVWTGSCKIDVGTWEPEEPKQIRKVSTHLSFDTDLEMGAYVGLANSTLVPESGSFALSEKNFHPGPFIEIANGQTIAATVTLSSGNEIGSWNPDTWNPDIPE